jgi:HlyD family secretion protein
LFACGHTRSHLNELYRVSDHKTGWKGGYFSWHVCWQWGYPDIALHAADDTYILNMDKKIKKKTWTLKRIATYTGIALFTVFIGYQFIFADRRSKLKIDREKITISTVQRGVFQEFIPQTGTVEPSRTVYLDAVEGGTIKRVVAESGAMVKKGDVIVELSNLNRELVVLQQEAQLNQAINEARSTRLGISQNDLQQRQELASIDNQLQILGPQYRRQKQLYEKKLIAKQDFEKTEADYKYYVERRKITYEVYKNDSIDRLRQLKQMNYSEQKMIQSLEGVGKILDNLVIRAPIDGELSHPPLDPGQNVNIGQRLGWIDVVGSYKVRVPIDELYLPRITKGLRAETTFNNKDYILEITYQYPGVTNGRFEVDMNFVGEEPPGLRRGLSLRLRIQLSQSSEELLLPVGGFYKDTGGNWVYVVEGDQAVRRDIKLGRKNTENFEVLEGLQPGDQVITSSYENFGDNEVLLLN